MVNEPLKPRYREIVTIPAVYDKNNDEKRIKKNGTRLTGWVFFIQLILTITQEIELNREIIAEAIIYGACSSPSKHNFLHPIMKKIMLITIKKKTKKMGNVEIVEIPITRK